uniref:ATP synthase subunit a n=1 Tax=Arge similis TaxID=621222 RepID=A0A3Q8U9W7_9HYME|nr:ATP synthase F0 subunit 6 [Arge similis]
MMMNLFSSFDPSTNIMNLSINWMSSMIGMMFIPQMYWIILPRLLIIWKLMKNKLHNELKILMKNKNKGTSLIFFSLFSFIMFNNFIGLLPYIFTSSSHLIFTLTLALPFWMSFMMFGWMKKTNHMFAHLVPMNTPNILMPFMVIIESISNLIRALTLSVRLTANMIAGHLLLTLLSSMSNMLSTYMNLMLILIQILLITLESAVSIIQAYVFMILITLYSSEVN